MKFWAEFRILLHPKPPTVDITDDHYNKGFGLVICRDSMATELRCNSFRVLTKTFKALLHLIIHTSCKIITFFFINSSWPKKFFTANNFLFCAQSLYQLSYEVSLRRRNWVKNYRNGV